MADVNRSNQKLGEKGFLDIISMLAALPGDTTSLNLSSNRLGLKKAAELGDIIAAIPPTVTTVDLSLNHLQDVFALHSVLSRFSPKVTSINLGRNGLGNKTLLELSAIFAAIPATVLYLDLDGNLLGDAKLHTSRSIAIAFESLAPKFIIGLNNNQLGKRTGAELAEIFTALKAVFINLAANDLGLKSVAELKAAFAGFPKTVALLNLSWNNFEDRTDSELMEIINAIPKHITTVWGDANFENRIRRIREAASDTKASSSQEQPFSLDSSAPIRPKVAPASGQKTPVVDNKPATSSQQTHTSTQKQQTRGGVRLQPLEQHKSNRDERKEVSHNPNASFIKESASSKAPIRLEPLKNPSRIKPK